jgi:hypothetical protein
MSEATDVPEQPWFEEYEQFGVPKTLEPYPDEPVHHFLYKTAEEHPDQGIVQFGEQYTYPDLAEQVDSLATALRDRGSRRGVLSRPFCRRPSSSSSRRTPSLGPVGSTFRTTSSTLRRT